MGTQYKEVFIDTVQSCFKTVPYLIFYEVADL